MIVGTPGFIAPEVIVHGIADDPRSDLYALGVVWLEMITATKPFEAPTPFALAVEHVQEAPPRPNDARPFSPVPRPVEAAILQLLEKSPDRRPASAVALGNLLRKLMHEADHPPERSTSMVRTRDDLAHNQATETGFAAFSPSPLPLWSAPSVLTPRGEKREPAIAAIIGAVVVIVVAAVGLFARALPDQAQLTVVDGGLVLSMPPLDAGLVAAPVVDAGVAVSAIVDAGVVVVVVVVAGVEAAPVARPKVKTSRPDKSHKPDLMFDP